MPLDVFTALSANGSTEPENHLTDSQAYLLRLLLERYPESGLAVIRHLAGPAMEGRPSVARRVAVATQVSVGTGRVDLHISAGTDALIYVEIKHDAPLGPGQLEYYRDHLDATGLPHRRLVLLSRSRATAQQTTLPPDRCHHVCWYQVHEWLADAELSDPVCRHFADDFVRFPEAKQMSIEKVSWEYMQGVPALVRLTGMMEAAVHELWPMSAVKRTAGWNWRGFFVAGSYFVGVRLHQPLVVVLEDNLGTNPAFKRDLDLEATRFFALTSGEQLEALIEFLRTSGVRPGEGASSGTLDQGDPA